MVTQQQIMAAGKYVRGIRNASKRVYAMNVMSYMIRQNQSIPERWELGFSAAQCVRLRLAAIIGDSARKLP